jgi:predicted nucleic acid-binding protein
MEVMVGAEGRLEAPTRSFLDGFETIGLDARIAEKAVSLRRERRIKLPDAVIWASAQVNGMILVTRNTKDFPAGDPGVRAPYGTHH